MLCKILGHKLDAEAAHYYGVFHCDRCGTVYERDVGVREWIRVRLALARYWLRELVVDARQWVRCSDCGRRFGRHDDAADHIPF
jgi:uncharacterized C2H2 Zn-finger protein